MSTAAPPVVAPQRRDFNRTFAVPPVPVSLADTGLSEDTISDLALKALYIQGARMGQELATYLCLPFDLLDDLLLRLQQRRFVEVKGAAAQGRGTFTFDVTETGRRRAKDALESNQYVGPVPVPLATYRSWILRQTIRNVHIDRESVRRGFEQMVIDEQQLETLGPAINSGKSLFLFGAPGNGKTLIAETISAMLGGELYVPYAVIVEGQTMLVYDRVVHHKIEEEASEPQSIWRRKDAEYDRRFARVRRPVVMAGGELTLDQLDLQFDAHTKMYQAPFQVKANGGVLIIDDFGRQRVPPSELLNRWIVPLERRIDYLSLHTGNKFPVPFDCLLVFATNLNPADLVEEAFLRRIHYKLYVPDPRKDQYEEIFRRVAAAIGVAFRQEAVDFLFHEYYGRRGIPARACHPRDILEHVCDTARYLGVPPNLDDLKTLEKAANTYFLRLMEPEA